MRDIMKFSEKKKPVNTVPEGVWESSHTDKKNKTKNKSPLSDTTDMQGNGYPSNKSGQ